MKRLGVLVFALAALASLLVGCDGGNGNVDELERSLDDMSSDLQALEADVASLEDRLSQIEVPGAVEDLDIQELYARTDYYTCMDDATADLRDAEWELSASYDAYLSENMTYDQFSVEYQTYQAAYDSFQAEADACWATYLSDSPFD
jgi:outer membrane murein-binding lipoprotein Lpp